jgi:hypothetical protein
MDDQGTKRVGGGMKYRKLRIAWSVAWGALCLLVVAMWVRSFTYSEGAGIALADNCVAWVFTVRGRVLIVVRREDRQIATPVNPSGGWSELVYPESVPRIERNTGPHVLGFGIVVFGPGIYRLRFPYWFLTSLTVALVVLPWVSRYWQFSLRTLLIGMTLAGVGLGLLLFAIRN